MGIKIINLEDSHESNHKFTNQDRINWKKLTYNCILEFQVQSHEIQVHHAKYNCWAAILGIWYQSQKERIEFGLYHKLKIDIDIIINKI